MKKSKLIMLIASVLILAAQGCTKEQPARKVYTGVVVYNICANMVIQTTGPEYLGQDTWVDSNNDVRPEYRHVFTVDNPCDMGLLNSGDTIRFSVVPHRETMCNSCMIYVETPDVHYSIQQEKS